MKRTNRIQRGLLALCLCALTVLAMHTSAEAAGTPWYQPALEYAVAHRIIPENGTVVQQPTGSLSRGTLATMLYQALDGQPASKHGRFQDVPPDSYCYDAVTWITEQGIASGTGKITFSPEGTVTREQLAVFLANAARVMGLSLSPVRTASSFTDAASVSPWARESLEYCWTRGILNGFQDGSFQPQKLTTRCEGVSSLVSEIQLKEGNRTSAAVSISAATQQTAAAQTGQPSQVSAKLIAHKGFSSLAPENTLTAFDLAGQNGFWGAECDVWSTSDGQYVLTHDAGLGRTCGVSGDVRSMTWEQVRNIPIRNGANIESYAGNLQATRIPLLADYLNICSRYGMVPVIELKQKFSQTQIQEIFRMASDAVRTEVWFISFELDNLTALKQLTGNSSRYRVSWLQLDVTEEEIRTCAAYGLNLSAWYDHAGPGLGDLCRNAGVPFHFWTINRSDSVSTALSYGPVSITSDYKLY